MEKSAEVAALARKLDDVLAALLDATHGSRSTLRIDDAARGWSVDYVLSLIHI